MIIFSWSTLCETSFLTRKEGKYKKVNEQNHAGKGTQISKKLIVERCKTIRKLIPV